MAEIRGKEQDTEKQGEVEGDSSSQNVYSAWQGFSLSSNEAITGLSGNDALTF